MSALAIDGPVIKDAGWLLVEEGFDDEIEAAVSLGITVQTLIEYRKAGKAPRHTIIGRKIFYSREARVAWLAQGGAAAVSHHRAIEDNVFDAPPDCEQVVRTFIRALTEIRG